MICEGSGAASACADKHGTDVNSIASPIDAIANETFGMLCMISAFLSPLDRGLRDPLRKNCAHLQSIAKEIVDFRAQGNNFLAEFRHCRFQLRDAFFVPCILHGVQRTFAFHGC